MRFTIFTYITTLLVVMLVILVLNRWINKIRIAKYSPVVLLLILAAPYIRLMMPFEFPWTIIIPSYNVYPKITGFFLANRFQIGQLTVSLFLCVNLIWAVGTFITLWCEIRRYNNLVKCFHHLNTTTDERLLEIYSKEIARYSSSRTFRIITTSCVIEPMIYGFIKPTILLPTGNFTDEELSNIIGHELCHYFHGHLLYKWILEILCAFHWWFRPMLILKGQLYNIMEIHVDNMLLKSKTMDQRIHYLNTLLRVGRYKISATSDEVILPVPILSSMYTYGDPNTLKTRFLAVKNMNQNHAKHNRAATIVLLSIFSLIIASFTFVLQPHTAFSRDDGSFTLDNEIHYFIQNSDGEYDLYDDKGFVGTLTNIDDECYHQLPVR